MAHEIFEVRQITTLKSTTTGKTWCTMDINWENMDTDEKQWLILEQMQHLVDLAQKRGPD